MSSIRFSLNLYESLGFFGLIDYHFEASPTQNHYPFVDEGEFYSDYRTLENRIALEFRGSVTEIRESLAERVKLTYQEFLWAFGLYTDNAAASNHFRIFGVA